MNLCGKAIQKWGGKFQGEMAIEECAEFITAIRHFDRDKATADDVIEEIADVQIMMEQMAILFGQKKVRAAKRKKLHRLKNRMESDSV